MIDGVDALLLLDVDGPLNPWAAKQGSHPPGYVEHRIRLSWWSRRRPLVLWLNPEHGAQLVALSERTGLRLAWASTWEHRANTMIGPFIGLPNLPVIEFAAHPDQSAWKYPAVQHYAAGRPLAWLDDDFDLYPAARDRFLADRARDGLATELVQVDRHTGITAEHLSAVEAWCGGL
ncbi:hypothetical protein GCM10010174_17330 [Kutzneria viridogrisea]|uniref:Secreted protein n=1 Tax=Kutzneria viridogrisea TaxID=47990 RepID=A0ABR6BDE1_9PSEU|nr:hypothetical protein [Kutzneria viridogrisea]